MSKEPLVEYGSLPLHAHAIVGQIPIHYVGAVDLPGGPSGLNLPAVMDVVGFNSAGGVPVGLASKALFLLRGLLGKVMGWDAAQDLVTRESYLGRLGWRDWARSIVLPGTVHGIVRDLYLFDREYLGEIINRTVHAFIVLALEPQPSGYRLVFAIHVDKVSWFTPFYMSLIKAPCYWIIYPSMRRGMLRRWLATFERPVLGSPPGLTSEGLDRA